MGAALSGNPWRDRAAASAGRCIRADRRRHEGVVRPMKLIHKSAYYALSLLGCATAVCRGADAPAATPAPAHATATRTEVDLHDATQLNAGRFGTVYVYKPAGTPKSVA